jgi:hypothetical protein
MRTKEKAQSALDLPTSRSRKPQKNGKEWETAKKNWKGFWESLKAHLRWLDAQGLFDRVYILHWEITHLENNKNLTHSISSNNGLFHIC